MYDIFPLIKGMKALIKGVKVGIVLVCVSADFRPFSINFQHLRDQYKSAKIMDLYMRGRHPIKGQNFPKSVQNGLFQSCEYSVKTIPVKVKF